MRVSSHNLTDGRVIPEIHAFGAPDADAHMCLGRNLSPHVEWSGLPAGVKSLALVCHDPDVPSRMGDVNREDREIPADLPRIVFYHWLVVDIDPALGELPEGVFSDGVTARGKDGPEGPLGTRQGLNTYTDMFAGDNEMEGRYFGYDGPCPPWNDSIVHRYVFTLYALDVERAPVEGAFRGGELLDAIEGRIVDQAVLTATYSLNPRLPA